MNKSYFAGVTTILGIVILIPALNGVVNHFDYVHTTERKLKCVTSEVEELRNDTTIYLKLLRKQGITDSEIWNSKHDKFWKPLTRN